MDDGLFLGAPPGHAWPLPATTLRTRLRERYPDAPLRLTESRVTSAMALDFEIPLADGDTHGGSYSETGVLALSDGSAELWADTMLWFLALLPPAAPVFAMREDNPTPTPLPPESRTDAAALTRFFAGLRP
ncbi:hypothetical protein GCM10010172_50910 [Paractinoplanes ferrugineus]|uniref:Uncharacterized protein n=1 Tax=Paractinoplanes ferrugineus TaxID=113564 RepID=A0A919J757_9ACTN|nr:hypothetical protein [Actinoplanes ferrugineus]GIE16091.1 hypothetical protein Afe05nite_79310 [Actinoplanes ferrugineus]